MKEVESTNVLIHTMINNNCSFFGVITKLTLYLIVFSFISYLIFSLKLFYPGGMHIDISSALHIHEQLYSDSESSSSSSSSSLPCLEAKLESNSTNSSLVSENPDGDDGKTQLHHIVFGISASSHIWNHRKKYIKLWWEPEQMIGFVWMDKPVKAQNDDRKTLPPVKVSNDTSRFRYKNKYGHRSAIRLTRIVSETLRLGLEDVRWMVLGDDDTFFVADNLVRVLSKYDHNQFYYIGSNSESHLQNIKFSYNMAYGGGGFAISYPLAKALEKIQDECIDRYPELYGSDDRIHACIAELGVPLTKEIGFHQLDLFGNIFGILAAHPIAPFVSLHHLDVIMSIFPNLNQFQALHLLKQPIKLDSAALMQQSICYDKERNWTISVSWGYAVQIVRGIILPRQMELPARTFVDWYRKSDDFAFTFNTRSFSKNSCQKPAVYTLFSAAHDPLINRTGSHYGHYKNAGEPCTWQMPNPSKIRRVEVFKKPNPFLWNKSPRRNCCRLLPSNKEDTLAIDMDECREGEIIGATQHFLEL